MNKLSKTNSIYLLQHAQNPVDWYPWDEEALEKAKVENKPIFLSIGYAACHWCHVMEKETFSDPVIADFMNQYFISIKVDREERPDLDKIYMDSVTAMTGQGGWPLSVFLTPDQIPFFGGTYFPPTPRYNLPSFAQVLQSIVDYWKKDPASLRNQGLAIKDHIQPVLVNKTDQTHISPEILSESVRKILSRIDWTNGGLGTQPKFPQPLVLDFLLTQTQDPRALEAVNLSLTKMSQGGLFDIIRGGFHRYSTDNIWSIPHFEKMLYDNALLAKTYLTAGILFDSDVFLEIGKKTLSFMENELLNHDGLFQASIDADSDHEEGKFYTWEKTAFEQLSQKHDLPENFFELNNSQSLDGRYVVRFSEEFTNSAKYLNHPCFRELKQIQDQRNRPITDDKILSDWNALTIQAFVLAGTIFKQHSYKDTALKAANQLLEKSVSDHRIKHVSRGNWASQSEFLIDYAQIIIAFIDLFYWDLNFKWFQMADRFAKEMINSFFEAGHFFDTIKNSSLFIRPSTIEDNITPSGISSAVQALMKINQINFNSHYEEIISQAITTAAPFAQQYPTAAGNWLQVINNWFNPPEQIIIVYPETIQNQVSIPKKYFQSGSVIHVTTEKVKELPLDLFTDKKPINHQITYYHCKNHQCLPPTNEFPY